MAAAYGALLDAVRGVQWPARAPVGSGSVGAHHSRQRGSSAEFAEYRAYRQGDDPRRLDWKLLARSDRAYVRLATDRAVLPTVLFVDASASMAYPDGDRSKWAQAKRIAIGLAAVAHATGDPVGLGIARDGEPLLLRPRTRRGVVAEIAETLDAIVPRASAPLAPLLALHGAARVAIVTDLLGDADALLAAARVHVAQGGEVHLVHVVAREELDPPAHAFMAVDPEVAGVQRALTADTRAGYVAAFHAWRMECASSWRGAGAWHGEVVTDEAAERAVRRIAVGAASAAPPAAESAEGRA